MLVTLKSLLRTLILPPAGPLLLAMLGAWLVARPGAPWRRRAGLGLLAGSLAGLWLLATPALSDLLWRVAQREPVLDLAHIPPAGAIVILGGSGARAEAPEYGGAPAVSGELLERVAYGALLARRTGLPVLTSGTVYEAQAMRATLARDFGVEVRWSESASRDTFENAEFSARLLRADGISRVLLVTHATHERRARREFEACGITVVPAPVLAWIPAPASAQRFVPNMVALRRSTDALYELLGDVARRGFAAVHLRRHTAP